MQKKLGLIIVVAIRYWNIYVMGKLKDSSTSGLTRTALQVNFQGWATNGLIFKEYLRKFCFFVTLLLI